MSAQPFFDHLTKDRNGNPVTMPGRLALGVENTDNSTWAAATFRPISWSASQPPDRFHEALAGTQVRINYWWFYGYQHPCTVTIG